MTERKKVFFYETLRCVEVGVCGTSSVVEVYWPLSVKRNAVIFNRGSAELQGSAEPQGSASICQGFRGSSVKKMKII